MKIMKRNNENGRYIHILARIKARWAKRNGKHRLPYDQEGV